MGQIQDKFSSDIRYESANIVIILKEIEYEKFFLKIAFSPWFVSDPRGLEIRGHGGRPRPAVAFLPRHHHRHRRHPHGRPPHLRVCRPGQNHRHLQGKVKKCCVETVARVKEETESEFRKSF